MEESGCSPAPSPEDPPAALESESRPSTSSLRPVGKKPGKKKKTKKTGNCPVEGGASESSLSRTRVVYKRRSPRVAIAPRRASEAEAIAFPLGMSIAAVVAQVLDREDIAREMMSVNRLSQICTSAVKESLSNVFGDKFSGFADNFEKSFVSTLSTLRLINDSSSQRVGGTTSGNTLRTPRLIDDSSSQTAAGASYQEQGFFQSDPCTEDDFENGSQNFDNVKDNLPIDSMNHHEIGPNSPRNQLACISRSKSGSVIHQPMYSTIEKSVMEQTRSNDLKTQELILSMEKMKLKKAELALKYDENHLGRSKLAMGISKASFKAEKFKTEVKDIRHAELVKRCVDCLVAGLVMMSISLVYGAYVFSFRRISEATASCAPLSQKSKSWWIPGPVASFNSGFEMLTCQVQVFSRMLFGILMILVVAYLLLQRSSCSNQTMPITFVLLLLGAGCGFAGKFCVDTLGGRGQQWLLIWEIFCLVHFLAITFTSALFVILHGPVDVALDPERRAVVVPYLARRVLFYGALLLFLPLSCGLVPFGSAGEWKDHFSQLVLEGLFINDEGYS